MVIEMDSAGICRSEGGGGLDRGEMRHFVGGFLFFSQNKWSGVGESSPNVERCENMQSLACALSVKGLNWVGSPYRDHQNGPTNKGLRSANQSIRNLGPVGGAPGTT